MLLQCSLPLVTLPGVTRASRWNCNGHSEGSLLTTSDAERLNLALVAARLGDWSWDASTDRVALSSRAAEILGVPPTPHLTWTAVLERLHEDDRDAARQAIRRAVADQVDYTVKYRVRTADGDRWVAASGRPRYRDGRVLGIIGVLQDISDEVRDREKLHEETESLEVLNRVGQMLAAELDIDKLVQALTDAATEVSGAEFGAFFYNVLDADGGSYMLYTLSGADRSLFEGFPMPRATTLFAPTFSGDAVIRLDDVRHDPRFGRNPPHDGLPPGHLPVCSYLAVPVTRRSGDVLGGLFFGHSQRGVFDARAERLVVGLAGQAAIALDNARLYDSAQRARQAAEEANRLKDEFLATLSHELRTPLNAVLGWARLLRGAKVDDARLQRAIETIERNAKAQQEIIEDLLDVSRIVSGKLRLEVAPVALAPIVEAAVETLRPTALARAIEVEVALPSAQLLVLGDASRLQQVVWNLLSNALKFSPGGSVVRVTLTPAGEQVELRVMDHGCGIPSAFLPHVFDRFRQADAGTTRTIGGLGLGLAIVRHLVEMHGGTVVGESPGEGRGATFTVRLPLVTTAVPAVSQPSASMASTGTDAASLAGLRVLVVDDEEDARDLVSEVLQEHGADVRTAGSATEGWTALEQWTPDVILS